MPQNNQKKKSVPEQVKELRRLNQDYSENFRRKMEELNQNAKKLMNK